MVNTFLFLPITNIKTRTQNCSPPPPPQQNKNKKKKKKTRTKHVKNGQYTYTSSRIKIDQNDDQGGGFELCSSVCSVQPLYPYPFQQFLYFLQSTRSRHLLNTKLLSSFCLNISLVPMWLLCVYFHEQWWKFILNPDCFCNGKNVLVVLLFFL